MVKYNYDGRGHVKITYWLKMPTFQHTDYIAAFE